MGVAPVQRLKARRNALASEKLVNWHAGATIETDKPWTIDDIETGMAGWV